MISSSTVVNSVVEKLRQALARGQWRTGDMLPGQRELAEQLGISRPSLREAVTAAIGLSLIAIFIPILVILALVVLLGILLWVWRRVHRWRNRRGPEGDDAGLSYA